MRNALLCLAPLVLAACAGRPEAVSEGEARISDIAAAKARGSRYPVLGTLPGAREVVGEGLPASLGEDLRADARMLTALDPAGTHGRLAADHADVVAELRALVAQVQADVGGTRPRFDIDALDFPVPPPLD